MRKLIKNDVRMHTLTVGIKKVKNNFESGSICVPTNMENNENRRLCIVDNKWRGRG